MFVVFWLGPNLRFVILIIEMGCCWHRHLVSEVAIDLLHEATPIGVPTGAEDDSGEESEGSSETDGSMLSLVSTLPPAEPTSSDTDSDSSMDDFIAWRFTPGPIEACSQTQAAAVDALIRAGAACSQSECVVVHCNNSFHRAPIAAATVLVRSGEYTVDDALTSEGCGLQPDTADRDTDMNAK